MVTIHEASRAPSASRENFDPLSPKPETDSTTVDYDPSCLSPLSVPKSESAAQFHSFSSLGNMPPSPPRAPVTPIISPTSMAEPQLETPKNPFNFETVQYSASRPGSTPKSVGYPIRVYYRDTCHGCLIQAPIADCDPFLPLSQNFGRRQGHKYKRSSVSHQALIDLELPANRAPLQIPASLPIPTFGEFRTSMNADQRLRALWCVCHIAVAGWVFWLAQVMSRESHDLARQSQTLSLPMTLTALSHLLFFDALGAVLCVAVDVGSNFEVWNRSSVAFPFGLRRLELLSSLSMGVGLLFMGFDLISHTLSHTLESHAPSQTDTGSSEEDRGSSDSVTRYCQVGVIASIAVTLVSASLLGNHARIGKALRSSGGVSPNSGSLLGRAISRLPGLLSNPSHLLTLSCSAAVLLVSVFPSAASHKHATDPGSNSANDVILDYVLSVGIASCMVLLGGRLCLTLGKMLLMSFPVSSSSRPSDPKTSSGSHISDVIQSIRADPGVSELEDARFWQVHYELAMANIRLSMPKHRVSEIPRLRERITALIRNRLSGGYGDSAIGLGKGFRWEVSVQVRLVD